VPLVSEVEEVGDPLPFVESDAVELDVGGLGVGLGLDGRGVLGLPSAPELAVEPERVEMVVVPAERAPEQVVQIVEGLVPRYGELSGNARVTGELGGQEVLGDGVRITGAGAVTGGVSRGPSCGQSCAAGLSLLTPLFGADRHPRPHEHTPDPRSSQPFVRHRRSVDSCQRTVPAHNRHTRVCHGVLG
jgi:hypothetical protein